MEWNCRLLSFNFSVFFFLLMLGISASSATFISVDVFETHASTGRSLLQAKKPCPANFEFLNYTIITSKCKGPQYSRDKCCGALVEFACPYAEMINDLTNDCASTMFSYINLYGKYPPGLFASECRDSKRGLECPETPPAKAANVTGSQIRSNPSPLLMVAAAFLMALFCLV